MSKKIMKMLSLVFIYVVIASPVNASSISKDKLLTMTGICTGIFGLYEIADEKDKIIIMKVIVKYANNFNLSAKQFSVACNEFMNPKNK